MTIVAAVELLDVAVYCNVSLLSLAACVLLHLVGASFCRARKASVRDAMVGTDNYFPAGVSGHGQEVNEALYTSSNERRSELAMSHAFTNAVFVSSAGKRWHRSDACYHLRKSSIKMLSPCRDCAVRHEATANH